MKRLVSVKVAANLLLISIGLLLIFHILVLLYLLPSNIVWSGQTAASPGRLLALEFGAMAVTLLFAAIIAAKAGYIPTGRFKIVATVGMWVVFAYLLLNPLGNLASGVTAEKLIFTPVSIGLALCALRLAIE